MKTAKELLQAYHNNINTRNLDELAKLFLPDGALELPYLASLGQGWRTEGGDNIKNMFIGVTTKIAPEFKFINIKFYIETPDQVFAEYDVDCLWNGKPYKQTYMGRLVTENGKIKLLREGMNMHPVLKNAGLI